MIQQPNLAGTKLADGLYILREPIGMGGMGTVYRAYQENLKRDVAIKVLPETLVLSGYLDRFIREATTAASLTHPHIVPVYDFGTQDNIAYIVMCLMDGGTLAERMKSYENDHLLPPLTEIAELLKQLASALDYAHSNHIIHRDVKPGNVLFDNGGNAYLSDFGIAKLTEIARRTENMRELTGADQAMGTPDYMAPEQWRSSKAVVPASDQYSLAVIVYSLLTGKRMYEHANTPYEVMFSHMNDAPTSPSVFRHDIPNAVSIVLGKALMKQPEQRFPTIAAFAHAFEHATLENPGKSNVVPVVSEHITPLPVEDQTLMLPITPGDDVGHLGPEPTLPLIVAPTGTVIPNLPWLPIGIGVGVTVFLLLIIAILLSTRSSNVDGNSTAIAMALTNTAIANQLSVSPRPLIVTLPPDTALPVLLATSNAPITAVAHVVTSVNQSVNSTLIAMPTQSSPTVATETPTTNLQLTVNWLNTQYAINNASTQQYINMVATQVSISLQQTATLLTLAPTLTPSPTITFTATILSPTPTIPPATQTLAASATMSATPSPASTTAPTVTLISTVSGLITGSNNNNANISIAPLPAIACINPPLSSASQPAGTIPMVFIQGGTFKMGSDPRLDPNAQPDETLHDVCVNSFWLDVHEVTNQDWDSFVKAPTGYNNPANWSAAGLAWLQAQTGSPTSVPSQNFSNPLYPHINVTWYEAQAYATWRGGRLPTEAEWEWAARGPNVPIYPWGNSWIPANLVATNQLNHTAIVCSKPTGNSWAQVCDMAGNAAEWVYDGYGPYITGGVLNNPSGMSDALERVVRGGAWNNPAIFVRSTARLHYKPDQHTNTIGFRIVIPTR